MPYASGGNDKTPQKYTRLEPPPVSHLPSLSYSKKKTVGSFSTAPSEAVNCRAYVKKSYHLPKCHVKWAPFLCIWCVHAIPVSNAQPFHSTGARQEITMDVSGISLVGSPGDILRYQLLSLDGSPADVSSTETKDWYRIQVLYQQTELCC